MDVTVFGRGEFKINIDCDEAFRLLCRALNMDYILTDKMDKLFVKKDLDDDELYVYHVVNGHDEIYDSRGKLFVAMANVATNMFPNVEFRGAEYIYE